MFLRATAFSGPRLAFHLAYTTASALLHLGLPAALICVACNCGGDKAVPFKRPGSQSSNQSGKDPEGTTSSAGPDQAEPGTPGSNAPPPFLSVTFPDAPPAVTIEGASLSLAQGHIHAALTRKLAGSLDALIVTSQEDGQGPTLAQSTQSAEGFPTPKPLVSLPKPAERCELREAEIQAPSPEHALAVAHFYCGPDVDAHIEGIPTPGAAAPERGALPPDQVGVYVLSNDRRPRLLAHLALHPSGTSPAPRLLRAEVSDVDNDGHRDIKLALALDSHATEDPDAADVAITLLNRTSGLELDPAQPEGALQDLANNAVAALASNPEEAIELASRALRMHADLCRGGATPRISLGDRAGLPCPASVGLGRAHSAIVAAYSLRGHVTATLTAQSSLKADRNATLLPEDATRVDEAMTRVPRSQTFRFRPGPMVSGLPLPDVHRPLVVFLDEQRLVLRGDPPTTYDWRTEARVPTSIVSSGALFSDPSGEFVAAEWAQACDGTRLRIFRPGQVRASTTRGAPVAEIPIRSGGQAGGCTNRYGSDRLRGSSLITLLRWGPQGLLLGRGPDLLFVPLNTATGKPQATGEAQPLPPGAPLPMDSEPDGFALQVPLYPWVSDAGLVLINTDNGAARLIDTTNIPGRLRSAALSPSGQRIAVLAGQQVWLGDNGLAE